MELPGEDAEYTNFSTDELAEFFWLNYLAFTSDDRQQRFRVHRQEGDLYEASRIVGDAFMARLPSDDLLHAVLASNTPTAMGGRARDGLTFVGAGMLENIWRSGDHEIFRRMAALGVPSGVLSEVEAAVWK